MNMDLNKLDKNNIQQKIDDYLKSISKMDITISANSVYDLLKMLKRNKIKNGPYPDVSLFEAANRIMTDLIILFGVKELLKKRDYNGILTEFDCFNVQFGAENISEFDIFATNGKYNLKGEVFNVSPKFFQSKKYSMLKKLRENKNENDILILVYNKDAVSENYSPKKYENEIHIPIDVEL